MRSGFGIVGRRGRNAGGGAVHARWSRPRRLAPLMGRSAGDLSDLWMGGGLRGQKREDWRLEIGDWKLEIQAGAVPVKIEGSCNCAATDTMRECYSPDARLPCRMGVLQVA